MSSALLERTHTVSGHAKLHVERQDVQFHNWSPDRVAIEIKVENRVACFSPPTQALIQSAPLGAFLPWQPLLSIPVPGLQPGETATLRAEAIRPHVAPLPPKRRTPAQLLTALGDDDSRQRRGLFGWRQRQTRRVLAPDVFQALGNTNVHWAGNLNIFIGATAVERHLAQALRVYPGRTNLAVFVVGCCRDAYAFDLRGEAANWNASLLRLTGLRPRMLDRDNWSTLKDRWLEVEGTEFVTLALCPPKGCSKGSAEVHVYQRSTGREAIVEFTLDPEAAGPGCFVVG